MIDKEFPFPKLSDVLNKQESTFSCPGCADYFKAKEFKRLHMRDSSKYFCPSCYSENFKDSELLVSEDI